MLVNNSIQAQYQGYLQTPYLWKGSGPLGLEQIELSELETSKFDQRISANLRLGKLVERFVAQELEQHENIELLAENIQILEGKKTLGELDCLLLMDGKPIHLEVVYKFYLYEATAGSSALEYWIGPNRRDSLVLKLAKLKEKQLPLLYHPKTLEQLEKLGLEIGEIEQRVCFKAQLFTPADPLKVNWEQLNPGCVAGTYLDFDRLIRYKDCKFYIPDKHDWLIAPLANKPWLNYTDAKEILTRFMLQESAPLVWVKHPKGAIEKVFVVWWRWS